MPNVSKLHRPGKGRPPKLNWRDLRVEWYDSARGKIITTIAQAKGWRGDDSDFRWEFVDAAGNTVVLRRSGLDMSSPNRD